MTPSGAALNIDLSCEVLEFMNSLHYRAVVWIEPMLHLQQFDEFWLCCHSEVGTKIAARLDL